MSLRSKYESQVRINIITDAIKARNKKAAKEKQYVSLLYLNPDKYTIVV